MQPALISVLSGAPQQAPVGTALPKPLVAKVTDANGNPVQGVTVTFVQQGGQAAFCTFAGGVNTAVTDVNGFATSAVMTAGPTQGQYSVQAWIGMPGPGAIGPANFSILNSAPGRIHRAVCQQFKRLERRRNYISPRLRPVSQLFNRTLPHSKGIVTPFMLWAPATWSIG